MSHFRYCNATYLTDRVRVSEEEPLSDSMKSLQILQNKMMRIILRKKKSDRVSKHTMLEELNMLSINQTTCMSILMESWKALNLGVESIKGNFKTRNSKRFFNHLQGDKDPKSFVSVAAKLYNLSSECFKKTNLTKVAQQEARRLVKSLPI